MTETAAPTRIHLIDLRTDVAQLRTGPLDAATVERYAEALRDGVELPPITVVDAGQAGGLIVADGHHRLAAAYQADQTHIDAEVTTGTERDAVWIATAANKSHGLALTNADKAAIVRTILTDPEWSELSDREIARRVGCSHTHVANHRRRLAERAAQAQAIADSIPALAEHIRAIDPELTTLDAQRIAIAAETEIHAHPQDGSHEALVRWKRWQRAVTALLRLDLDMSDSGTCPLATYLIPVNLDDGLDDLTDAGRDLVSQATLAETQAQREAELEAEHQTELAHLTAALSAGAIGTRRKLHPTKAKILAALWLWHLNTDEPMERDRLNAMAGPLDVHPGQLARGDDALITGAADTGYRLTPAGIAHVTAADPDSHLAATDPLEDSPATDAGGLAYLPQLADQQTTCLSLATDALVWRARLTTGRRADLDDQWVLGFEIRRQNTSRPCERSIDPTTTPATYTSRRDCLVAGCELIHEWLDALDDITAADPEGQHTIAIDDAITDLSDWDRPIPDDASPIDIDLAGLTVTASRDRRDAADQSAGNVATDSSGTDDIREDSPERGPGGPLEHAPKPTNPEAHRLTRLRALIVEQLEHEQHHTKPDQSTCIALALAIGVEGDATFEVYQAQRHDLADIFARVVTEQLVDGLRNPWHGIPDARAICDAYRLDHQALNARALDP
jgi:ParB-like chromosome segregation protein Spo0J